MSTFQREVVHGNKKMWEQLVEYYSEEDQPILIAKVRMSIIHALKEVQKSNTYSKNYSS